LSWRFWGLSLSHWFGFVSMARADVPQAR